MTRADRLTLVRQHRAEGMSQRQIAKRLGVSKDTVRRDLEQIASRDETPAETDDAPDDPDAPQVAAASTVGDAPAVEPPGEPESLAPAIRPVADAPPVLPRRIPVGHRLVLDLERSPSLRRGLAELAATGLSPEALVAQAVAVLAVGYREGVARGRIRSDAPFLVRGMTVGPPEPGHAVPRRTLPPAPAEGA
ncbi:helix-turn-helix domain-containing protein [Streptomyces sp900105755]|uniref:helix-turn-helix domain-containing protein n=1 Tax=Streptomyces sp. 900105755 TaxID=3154389 RepID=UPI00331F56B5